MTLKRQGAIQTYMSYPLSKRVKRLETVQRQRKPEMKYVLHSISTAALADASVITTELTSIAQGNAADEREGNHVKFVRVEVRGYMDSKLDGYLIQCHTTTAPAYANFNGVAGGALAVIDNNTKFTEWKHFTGSTLTNIYDRISQRFRFGFKAKYNGTAATNCVDNRLYLVIKNNTGAAGEVRLTIRCWYTDV